MTTTHLHTLPALHSRPVSSAGRAATSTCKTPESEPESALSFES